MPTNGFTGVGKLIVPSGNCFESAPKNDCNDRNINHGNNQ